MLLITAQMATHISCYDFDMSAEQPWLKKKNWADNAIPSDARHGHWVVWGFALFWNLVTLPLFLQFEEIWEKTQREPITALAFLFPLVGLALIGIAIRATRQKQRFGLTPLEMDPFPGSLGGQVGGRIDTAIPYVWQQPVSVSLSCIHSRVSGSGKNRSRSESVKWHSEGVCHTQRTGKGTLLRFRFDVPAGLPASEPHSRSYHLWRLRVHAELPGTDFDRKWELPVFDTGGATSGIEEGTESHPATMDAAMAGVESVADITPVADGIQARFPAMQRPGQGIFMLVFGLLFAGVGVFVGVKGESLFLAATFTVLGTLFAAGGVFYLGKSLLVAVTREGLRARRFLFGYPLSTRQLAVADLKKLKIKQSATMQSGNKTTVYYQLVAKGREGKSFPVAERLTSRPEAELLRDTYLTYLGVGESG
jgi:hypothetical protein